MSFLHSLRYKPEGCGFNSRWCQWNFSLTWYFWPYYGPEVDLASNRNEYQEYFLEGKGGRCVGLTTLPLSCVECLEIWEPQTLGTFTACTGLQRDCSIFHLLRLHSVDSRWRCVLVVCYWQGKPKIFGEGLVLLPPRPPQIPYEQACDRGRAFSVRSRRLTA